MQSIGLFHELQDTTQPLNPDRTVIGGFTDPEAAQQVLLALVDQFGRLNVSVLFGPEGLRMLSPGNHHESGAGMLPGPRSTGMDRLRQETATLRRGGFLVAVRVGGEPQKGLAAATLREHGAAHVTHFDRAVIEHL